MSAMNVQDGKCFPRLVMRGHHRYAGGLGLDPSEFVIRSSEMFEDLCFGHGTF